MRDFLVGLLVLGLLGNAAVMAVFLVAMVFGMIFG